MKKLLIILCSLLLVSCKADQTVNYTYDIVSSDVDMSSYPGVTSVNHCFKQIIPDELFKCVENNSSGVFVLSYETCPYCRQLIRYLNQAGLDNGVTIYYIDAMDPKHKYVKDSDQYQKTLELLYDYTDSDDEGEKCLWTPTVFSIINGKVSGFQISTSFDLNGNMYWTFDNPTEDQINKLLKTYNKILKPFANK